MKKLKKYSFFIMMCTALVGIWAVVLVSGYRIALDGSVYKVEANAEDGKGKEPQNEVNMQESEMNSLTEVAMEETQQLATEKLAEEVQPQTEIVTDTKEDTEREFYTADVDYLDGALFIGDSRTATFAEYAGWKQTIFWVEKGLTIWDVMDEKLATDVNTGAAISVREGLQQKQYDKIYFMLGINELGTGTADSFYEQYKIVIDEIKELQPNAVIFVRAIIHVTQGIDDQGTYINNEEIYARNEKIQTIPDQKQVFWLDENELFDEEGTQKLNKAYTNDGVHIRPDNISRWRDYLLEHAIEIEG